MEGTWIVCHAGFLIGLKGACLDHHSDPVKRLPPDIQQFSRLPLPIQRKRLQQFFHGQMRRLPAIEGDFDAGRGQQR